MLPHWTQTDVSINGVQLHYYRTGHGDKRPLVLVHGFSDNGLCWAQTAYDLESEYDVIMPDMRGHGLSARVQPDEKVDMAADLAGLIRALGLERPVVGGHSMGARVTFDIGVRFPELASALILEDPPFRLSPPVPAPPTGQPGENPMANWAKSLQHRTREELLVEYRAQHPNWSDSFIRTMVKSKKQLDPTIVETLTRRLPTEFMNWLDSIQNISLPTLLITANPELGAIVTAEAAAKIHELNPNVTIVNVPDVGHLIRFDNYPVFIEAVKAFLKQVS